LLAQQFSWQAQHFERVQRHFTWQAQHFRRMVLHVLRIALAGLRQVATDANSMAGVAVCEMCKKLTEASHETSILR